MGYFFVEGKRYNYERAMCGERMIVDVSRNAELKEAFPDGCAVINSLSDLMRVSGHTPHEVGKEVITGILTGVRSRKKERQRREEERQRLEAEEAERQRREAAEEEERGCRELERQLRDLPTIMSKELA